ncbi:MAG: TrmH family RNA methyltransferase [Bacilli bacterium]|nr:TrmH family RNA methyltransferase [Bacilli bacterium]
MTKYDKDSNVSYTLGTTLTLELLNKKVSSCNRVYIHSKQLQNDTLNKILDICKNNNIEVIYSDKIINKLSDKENCYIVGEFTKFDCDINYNENSICLVNPSNAGNLGTIIRTCAGFNIKNLIIIEPAVDIFNPKVVRASMGAIFNINFKYFKSFEDYKKLTNNAFYPFMLKGSTNLHVVDKKNPYTLIFGNEATGLDDSYLNIGTPVRINHTNNIDSLNLDNAVSIAVYEFTKEEVNKNE